MPLTMETIPYPFVDSDISFLFPTMGLDDERKHPGLIYPHVSAAAAAAAKSLQSCQTLCDPIDSSPPGSPIPGILQARTVEWAAISFSSA